MKVLIICYCYPPDPGPRAYRWSAIAEHWAQAGHEVHVISARKGGAPVRETLNGVSVYRVGGAISENLRVLIERRRCASTGDNKAATPNLGSTSFRGWVGLLKRLHDLTWQKVYWPESTCLWYFPAKRKALELVRNLAFDAVISVSTPFTGHLVAMRVKRAWPKLHWLVDIGDPLSFGEPPFNNERLHDARNQRAERAVLAAADAASVTVQTCADEYARRFPETAGKITVIPPLYSGPPLETQSRPPANGKRRLVFTGSLYAAIRNPAALLEMMARVIADRPDLELHFYGRVNDCAEILDAARAKLDGCLFVHGPVPRAEAQAAVQEAHALINIGNKTRFQLPSKLVDYAAAGKPIINLITVPDDASVAFLRDYPQSLTVSAAPSDPVAEAEKLARFLDTANPIAAGAVTDFMAAYGIDAIEQAYRKQLPEGGT